MKTCAGEPTAQIVQMGANSHQTIIPGTLTSVSVPFKIPTSRYVSVFMRKHSQETRHRILESALVLFSKNGYDATSVDEICQASGVSKGAFYHHFPTKQSIFLELLERWLVSLDAQLSNVRARSSDVPQALSQMAQIAPLVLQNASGKLPMFLEFWTRASRDENIWQAVIAPYQRYRQFFASLIQEGVQEGSLQPTDPEVAARLVVALSVGLILQGVLEAEAVDWGRVTRESITILLKGLAKKVP